MLDDIVNDKLHFGPLNRFITECINRRKLDFHEFSEMFINVYKSEYDEFGRCKLLNIKNACIRAISGYHKLGIKRFIFLLEKVLHEPIPDDPEIQQLLLIGQGKDLRNKTPFGRLTVLECKGTDSCGT